MVVMSKGPKLPDKKFDEHTTTIAEVRAYLKGRALNGTTCPCCSQEVKVVEKEIHPYMARTLILMYLEQVRRGTGTWMHVASVLESTALANGILLRPGEWAKLQYWGLILERPKDDKSPKDDKEKGKRGFFQVTSKGESFVKGAEMVQRAALLYNDRLLGHSSDKQVSIHDVLGKDLAYVDLMAGKFGEGPSF